MNFRNALRLLNFLLGLGILGSKVAITKQQASHIVRQVSFLTCVLFFFQGQAFAASVDANGRGQVLLFPFVTSGQGWDTYLGLNLSPFGGQIVRLRFLDPETGEVTNTFNIYSSKGENWRSAVTESQSGPTLVIGEGSCTVADNGAFGGSGTVFDIENATSLVEAYLVSLDLEEALSDAPCDTLASRWQNGGSWVNNPNAGLEETSPYESTFSGYFDLIRVSQGLSSALPAIAIGEFAADVPHTAPQSESPNLASADPIAILPSGAVVEFESGSGIDAIALILSTRYDARISNNVITVNDIAASTDWIVTFPLRGYGYSGGFTVDFGETLRLCDPTGDDAETAPFLEEESVRFWTMSGDGLFEFADATSTISPTPIRQYAPFLCNTVNVVSFGSNSPIFLQEGSNLQYRVRELYDQSLDDMTRHIEYSFKDATSILPQEVGRPVIAFRATTYVNGTLEGGSVLANYMAIRYHDRR